MYNLISFNVKCKHCLTSLMDQTKLIDNKPSVRIGVRGRKGNGYIWLSSIYGSYNFITDVEFDKDEIAELSCPHCFENLASEEEHCSSCDAPMVAFYLEIGGKVSICPRYGCQNHNIEFVDLSTALKKMYNEYGFGRGTQQAFMPKIVEKEEPEVDENLEIINTGTFLNSYCPLCKKNMVEEDMFHIIIVNKEGEEGNVSLSPYLNVFNTKSTIYIPEDYPVKDVLCPHCRQSLLVDYRTCEECGSPVAKVNISARTKFISFYLCSKKGCRWHGLSDQDLGEIRLEDSDEW